MIRRSLLLFCILLLLTCKHEKANLSLFYNKALEDSLELYISQSREIINPYGAPTIMDIWINVQDCCAETTKDTIVYISPSYMISGPPGYAISIDEPLVSYPFSIMGAGWVKGRMCVIKCINNMTFAELINDKLLTIPRKEYDFFYQYEGPHFDISVSRSDRIYKLNGKDSVILLERR